MVVWHLDGKYLCEPRETQRSDDSVAAALPPLLCAHIWPWTLVLSRRYFQGVCGQSAEQDAASLLAGWRVHGKITTQQVSELCILFFFPHLALNGRIFLTRWDECAVQRRGRVVGADCALVFAAGTTDEWLCNQPALWADETAANCVQLLCRN